MLNGVSAVYHWKKRNCRQGKGKRQGWPKEPERHDGLRRGPAGRAGKRRSERVGGVLRGLPPALSLRKRVPGLLRISHVPARPLHHPALPQGQKAADGASGQRPGLPKYGQRDRPDARRAHGDK